MEGSYQFANKWWLERKSAVDGVAHTNPHSREIELLRGRADILMREARDPDHAERAADLRRAAERLDSNPALTSARLVDYVGQLDDLSDTIGVRITPDMAPVVATDELFWSRRRGDEERAAVPGLARFGPELDRYLAAMHVRAESGHCSHAQYGATYDALRHFRGWVGEETPLADFDVERWEQYWLTLMSSPVSESTRKLRHRHARSFLRSLVEKRRIDPLSNLDSRRHRFGGGAVAIEVMELGLVREIILQAKGQLRLHLLLMANCGMNQVDISNLGMGEVDWVEGRIIRKRSKTASHGRVPVVRYKLWPRTRALLEQYRQASGEIVLLTEKGGRWLQTGLKDGRMTKTDNISSAYNRLKARLKKGGLDLKSPRSIRKTSATLLGGHEVHRNYVEEFLGHAPSTIATKHYMGVSGERFDEAILWLGQQYGLAD